MEQRRKTRFPLNLKLELVESNAEPSSGRTIDISSSGVRFWSEKNLPVGHSIVYLVTLLESEPRVTLRCNGRVVRNRGADKRFEIAATVERHETLREFIAAKP